MLIGLVTGAFSGAKNITTVNVQSHVKIFEDDCFDNPNFKQINIDSSCLSGTYDGNPFKNCSTGMNLTVKYGSDFDLIFLYSKGSGFALKEVKVRKNSKGKTIVVPTSILGNATNVSAYKITREYK